MKKALLFLIGVVVLLMAGRPTTASAASPLSIEFTPSAAQVIPGAYVTVSLTTEVWDYSAPTAWEFLIHYDADGLAPVHCLPGAGQIKSCQPAGINQLRVSGSVSGGSGLYGQQGIAAMTFAFTGSVGECVVLNVDVVLLRDSLGQPYPYYSPSSGQVCSVAALNLYVDDQGACAGNSPCYSSIESAAFASGVGANIWVHPGTYLEDVNVWGRTVRIVATGGPSVTTLNGGGTTAGFVIGGYADVNIEGFTIASTTGGILASPHGSPERVVVRNNIIAGNTNSGIKVWSSGSQGFFEAEFLGNRILNNQTGIEISMPDGTTGSIRVSNNVVAANSGSGVGGISVVGCCYSGSSQMRIDIANNTIFGNAGTYGGGMSLSAENSQVVNNIIYGNSTSSNDYPENVRLAETGASVQVHNNIIGEAIFDRANGNFNLDPQLADPANGDFHLTAGSPAIERGENLFSESFDFDGDARPADADGDGFPIVDMGADEFCPGGGCVESVPRPGLPICTWEVVPSPSPGPDSSLSRIAAISANDIWAVGTRRFNTYPLAYNPLIEHWDGEA